MRRRNRGLSAASVRWPLMFTSMSAACAMSGRAAHGAPKLRRSPSTTSAASSPKCVVTASKYARFTERSTVHVEPLKSTHVDGAICSRKNTS